MITIVDYGMGNLGSVTNMLKKCGVKSIVSCDKDTIRGSEKIILPGVGAFDTAMRRIDELDLRNLLCDLAITRKIPVLGICLGMQLMMESSEEGILPGLGLIKGRAIHFRNHIPQNLRIPHMGWNTITFSKRNNLTSGFPDEIRFYFVHSFYVRVETDEDSLMKCVYGIEFDAAVQKGNIVGAQFHPEKSHRFGIQFFKNFASI